MKRLFFVMAALVAGITCMAAALPAQGDDDKKVEKCILDKNVTIEIDTIMPSNGPARQTSDGYTITIADGKVNAELPYFGEAYTAIVPGVDEPGIRFDDCPVDITVDKKNAKKKGQYEWRFTAKSGTDDVQVYVTLWTSGEADVRCQPTSRSGISYRGTIITE